MLEREFSLRRIKEVLTQPKIWRWQGENDKKAFIPNQSYIYYRVGEGLIFYEPNGDHVYLHTAIVGLPERPIQGLLANFEQIKDMGYKKVYAYIDSGHHRACFMARAAGMERQEFDNGNLFMSAL